MPTLLLPHEPESLVALPARREPFAVDSRFTRKAFTKSGVRVKYIDDEFLSIFGTKVEEPREETTLHYRTIERDSQNGPILAELLTLSSGEVPLSDIHQLLVLQAKGRVNALLGERKQVNVFFAKDAKGDFCAVSISPYYFGRGWTIGKKVIDDYAEWGKGYRVFYPSC